MKILIITELLSPYRIPFWETLALNLDIELTVAHTESKYLNEKTGVFNQIIYNKRSFSGLFFTKTKSLINHSKEYDLIICMFNIRFLNIYHLLLLNKTPVVLWGIGLSSDNGFGKKNFLFDRIRIFCAKKAASLIFYSDLPFTFYIKNGLIRDKLFIAQNTIKWQATPDFERERDSFLFIGSLYQTKRIDLLIEAINILRAKVHQPIKLIIVGNGDQKSNLMRLVSELNLEEIVFFKGSINDENELQRLYDQSILCISPGQAGLTILQSMAAGVAFVTSSDAITGGEISSIENGKTGITYDGKMNTLIDIMEDALTDKSKYIQIGKNARRKYEKNFKIENMVENFKNCIHYALRNK
jgi:glycosyltransferase involved in cell wall biosynthesis